MGIADFLDVSDFVISLVAGESTILERRGRIRI